MSRLSKLSVLSISLLQSLGLVIYILIISVILFNANQWFGPINGLIGPLLFLTLFSVSVLICGLLTGGYAFYLFWQKKEVGKAVKIVALTTLWLFVFLIVIFTAIYFGNVKFLGY